MAVNRLLLPVKVHYVLYFAAMSGSVPFLITYAQQLGATPSTIGALYASLPFMVMVAKPLLSGVGDKFQQHKTVLLGCIALMVSGFFSVYFIPAVHVHRPAAEAATATAAPAINICSNSSLDVIANCPSPFLSPCRLRCTQVFDSAAAECINVTDMDSRCRTVVTIRGEQYACKPTASVAKAASANMTVVDCETPMDVLCSANCSSELAESAPPPARSTWFRGMSVSVLMLWMSMSIAYVGMGVSVSLGDALTLDLLGENTSRFGLQRLFGSLGWGTFSVVAGQLIDLFSTDHENLDYSPGFYMTLIIGIADIFVASRIQVIKKKHPKRIARNVGRLLLNPRVFVFSVAVFFMGMVTGVMWTFLILFLFNLGSSQLLIGLVLATQCFLGELPFFFVSGWFLKKLGHAHSVTLALFVFGIRFLLYSLVTDPWTVLPIETMNGITYGVFFTALATYSSHIAPPGMSATVQGILQGIYEGFGVGVGCLIGGILFQEYGGSVMFFICGLSSVAFSIMLAVANYVLDKCMPLPMLQPMVVEIPEIRQGNKADGEEDGAVVNMLNHDGLAIVPDVA